MMKKYFKLGCGGIDIVALFVIAVCFVITGCTSLENKTVILDSRVQGFKVTTGADTTSGTPLPNISAGWGSNLLITMPTDKKGTMEYKTESGSLFGQIFGIEVKGKTEIRVTSGDSKITVTSKTDDKKEVVTEVGNGVVTVNVTEGTVISTPPAVNIDSGGAVGNKSNDSSVDASADKPSANAPETQNIEK